MESLSKKQFPTIREMKICIFSLRICMYLSGKPLKDQCTHWGSGQTSCLVKAQRKECVKRKGIYHNPVVKHLFLARKLIDDCEKYSFARKFLLEKKLYMWKRDKTRREAHCLIMFAHPGLYQCVAGGLVWHLFPLLTHKERGGEFVFLRIKTIRDWKKRACSIFQIAVPITCRVSRTNRISKGKWCNWSIGKKQGLHWAYIGSSSDHALQLRSPGGKFSASHFLQKHRSPF